MVGTFGIYGKAIKKIGSMGKNVENKSHWPESKICSEGSEWAMPYILKFKSPIEKYSMFKFEIKIMHLKKTCL